MGQSLELKTWGNPDNAYTWLLHNSGVSLATGYQVTFGDGNESPLYLGTGMIGVKNAAGFVTTITGGATAARAVTIADAPGTLSPESIRVAAADTTNATTTPTAVSAFDFTPLAGATYEFEALLLMQSSGTGVGVRAAVAGPAEVTMASWFSQGPGTLASNQIVGTGSGLPATSAGTNVPVINTSYPVLIRGIYKVTGTPSSDVRVQIYASTTGTVKVMTGSFIRHRRIS